MAVTPGSPGSSGSPDFSGTGSGNPRSPGSRATGSAVPGSPVPGSPAPGAPAGSRPGGGARLRPPRDRRPVRRLTVLYDPACRLCVFAAGWLARQRQLVPLDLVPAGSVEARRRFPALDHAATAQDVTVVADGGQVYRGGSAWVVCLWALRDHRAFSHTLTTPAGRRLARAAVLSAAKYRASARRSTTRPARQAHPTRAAAPAPPRIAPGWTYDPVRGWTQAPGPAAPERIGWTYSGDGQWSPSGGGSCADGCGTDPG